jgi:hypothetical protein
MSRELELTDMGQIGIFDKSKLKFDKSKLKFDKCALAGMLAFLIHRDRERDRECNTYIHILYIKKKDIN